MTSFKWQGLTPLPNLRISDNSEGQQGYPERTQTTAAIRKSTFPAVMLGQTSMGLVAACSATMPAVRLRQRTCDQPASPINPASAA